MGITHEISSQSMTGHRPSSLRSLDLENLNTGENLYSPTTGHRSPGNQPIATGQQTLYQPTVSVTHAIGMEFTNNQSNAKRVLLPLEPDFSNMSDPSVILEPPNNDWRSDNGQAQTPLSGHMSRRDQSKTKHRSKKRRRRRLSSTASSSRSISSDSRKKSRRSKRSKHSHKKRKRRYTSSSSSSSDSQLHDYGRYKRTRHSPQAVQNMNILQPAEITNVQTILPEQTL